LLDIVFQWHLHFGFFIKKTIIFHQSIQENVRKKLKQALIGFEKDLIEKLEIDETQ
jgi:hypothetical protein